MTNTESLPPAVRQLVEAHLEQVSLRLNTSGLTTAERMSIREDLAGQITEMLNERCEGTPTTADARAVLAELDSAENYSQKTWTEESPAYVPRRILPLSVAAAITSATGIILPLIYVLVVHTESARQQAAAICFLVTGLGLAIGITAIREMRTTPELRHGYLLGFISVICLPICFGLWANREVVYPINSRLMREAAEYVRSQQTTVLTAEGQLEQRPVSEVSESDQILNPATSADRVKRPFIPWVTTGQGARLFSIVACFGPTILLSLIFVPVAYRRLDPNRI